ncbi:endonuclease/exonuclease/phosphatase family metal-dependent hydrolase [Motilibacter peucedani]|uniref:Endonuclease/exonuclease/phosphatase family metal-dependent hydrolase n=1 Tax=Motilibacter peucedani TaxID=598650 RepID=A0A420XKZ2_9ACTN|nr:endonuclease/exonuclease/phosphatase family protein [Motilibacter peucedani]RKS68578.1 endonuclease/exonuclease/phosphatase family metal-dependent hydrolase [Motilibacter peucedani]
MRIATFNLLSGRAMGSEAADPDVLRAAVQQIDADVLALQEVDRHQVRSGGIDQTALVAEAMRAEHWRFVPALVGTPGETWRAAGPQDEESDEGGSHQPAAYGIAIASRLPVVRWRVVHLRPVPVVTPMLLRNDAGRRRLVMVRDEPRAAVVAVIEGPDGPFTVANTHLSFIPGWNAAQLRRLVAALADEPRPHFLVGDLNMPGKLPRDLCRDWTMLATEKTWPTHVPRAQLDHVLGRGDVPEVRDAYALELPLSDHRALVVDLANDRAESPVGG